MHDRRPAPRQLRARGAAVGTALAMLALVLPQAPLARGGEVSTPVHAAVVGNLAAVSADAMPPVVAEPGQGPSEMYLDAQQHAGDPNTFVPGGRVSIGFSPRGGAGSTVGGGGSRALPAGRLSGAQMAGAAIEMTQAGLGSPITGSSPGAVGARDVGTANLVAISPRKASPLIAATKALATPAAGGLRRDVYGFLPYWELSDPSARLNFSVLSHVAYFSLAVDGAGNLVKKNSDGSLTTGWAGWTSARMTDVISEAHASHTRVTLTLSVFAWTAGQAAVQTALLGSPSARENLASQAVAAVRDRGADGINLDFEPLVSGYEDGFVALIRAIRADFETIGPGYHVSFDTLGQPANYPLEDALGPGGADAVFVMGYDYRTASSKNAGSVDPLHGPVYDLTETIQAYLARVAAGQIILGIPYYGRAWSTASDAKNAPTLDAATYGASTAVTYDNAAALADKYGRRYDDVEISAWIAYQKSCPSGGCTATWRQLYYDDAQTLRARYDVINQSGIRGVGIWALGYDGSRPELYQALADKFLTDTTPPLAGITMLPPSEGDEGFTVSWNGVDDWHGVASYDVQVSTDGGPWLPWLSGTQSTSEVWLGADGHAYSFRVSARDGVGNASPWNVTSVFAATPTLAPGGFGRVIVSQLNIRAAPGTSAARLASATMGDVFAITGGPASADGYTWYQVSGPITAWQQAGYVRSDVWVAAGGSGDPNLVAVPAPNGTVVQATIRGVTFGADQTPGASDGTSPAAIAARSFSPNGDGSKDSLAISWTNTRALDTLSLQVYGPDGSPVGSLPLPANLAAGPQAATWDGLVGGVPVPDGSYLLQLAGSAAGAPAAWPSASPVTPGQRAAVGITVDTQPPTLSGAAISATRLSPNGDGRTRSVTATGTGSPDVVGWSLVVTPAAGGPAVRTLAGAGPAAKATWDGRTDDGSVVADGSYTLTLAVVDAAGNQATHAWAVTVDSTPPVLELTATPAAISPDGDGTADSTRLAWTSGELATGSLRLLRGSAVIRKWSVSGTSGVAAWTGRDTAGRAVPDGRYTLTLDLADATGNRATQSLPLVVDRTVGFLRVAPGLFYPQDNDALAATATISFRLARTAKVTLAIVDASSGTTVRGAMTNATRGPGTWTWAWNGRGAGGAMVPRGTYIAVLTVKGPYGTTELRRRIVADAFSTTLSATTVTAGQQLTVRFRSAEPLASLPTATLRQAGLAPLAMAVIRLADGTFRATATVADGGAGPATLVLAGRDTARHVNSSTISLTVQ
jgi:spore germination protein YaaH/flagellar hook assembly protein FlgD